MNVTFKNKLFFQPYSNLKSLELLSFMGVIPFFSDKA